MGKLIVIITGVVGALVLAACGGGGHARSTRTSSIQAAVIIPRPFPSAARRMASICRHRDSFEDQNVLTTIADYGVRDLSPTFAAAADRAAKDIGHEARAIRAVRAAAATALADDMSNEAIILHAFAHLVDLRLAQPQLWLNLRHQIKDADQAGVAPCQGVQPSGLVPNPPPLLP